MNQQEEMLNELARIMSVMQKLEPTSEEYKAARNSYSELMHTLHEDFASCDSDLDHRLKRKIEEAMMELKKLEAQDNMKKAKMEATVSLIKIGMVIFGMLLGIIVTGSLEQSTILSQKCFSFIRMLTPKII